MLYTGWNRWLKIQDVRRMSGDTSNKTLLVPFYVGSTLTVAVLADGRLGIVILRESSRSPDPHYLLMENDEEPHPSKCTGNLPTEELRLCGVITVTLATLNV